MTCRTERGRHAATRMPFVSVVGPDVLGVGTARDVSDSEWDRFVHDDLYDIQTTPLITLPRHPLNGHRKGASGTTYSRTLSTEHSRSRTIPGKVSLVPTRTSLARHRGLNWLMHSGCGWYNCVTRCVRALLLGDGDHNRKDWLEDRLEELAEVLKLVDYTGRLFRLGKAAVSTELAGIFERLGGSTQSWQARLGKLKGDRRLGRRSRPLAQICTKFARVWASGMRSNWRAVRLDDASLISDWHRPFIS